MNAVAAIINIPPALPIAAIKGSPATAAAQAPAFGNVIQSLLGRQPLGSTQPAPQQTQPQSDGPQADSSETNLPQTPDLPVSASRLADAMIRSMFTSASNVALVNSAAPNPAPRSKPAQPRTNQGSPAAPSTVVATGVAVIDPSPLMRWSGSATKATPKLPAYASVLPASAKSAVAAPLAFALRVTPTRAALTPSGAAALMLAEAAPKTAQAASIKDAIPAPQDASESGNAPAPDTAGHDSAETETGAPAAEVAAEQPVAPPEPTPAGPAAEQKTTTASTAGAQLHENAVTSVAATAAGTFSGQGSSDFAGDLAHQMPGEATSAAGGPTGKTQNPAAPSATDALRAAAPSAPASSAQPTSPLKEIAVRISAPQAPAVDVHLAERAGQLHVAVRTMDGGLQTSLRQDLGTLVNSLERSGYRAESFTPRADGTPAAASTQTGFENGRQDSGSSPGGRGGSQESSQDPSQDRGQQQQQQRRDPRPAKWIEELENQS